MSKGIENPEGITDVWKLYSIYVIELLIMLLGVIVLAPSFNWFPWKEIAFLAPILFILGPTLIFVAIVLFIKDNKLKVFSIKSKLLALLIGVVMFMVIIGSGLASINYYAVLLVILTGIFITFSLVDIIRRA